MRYMMCVSVLVCVLRAGNLLKWLHLGSFKQRHRDPSFLMPKMLAMFGWDHCQWVW